MTKIVLLIRPYALSFLLLLSCIKSFSIGTDTSTIVAGTAKISGRITFPSDKKEDSISINITVPHVISGEYVKYKVFTDRFGKFSFDVDVETAISLVRFHTSLNPEKPILVKLTSGGVTTIQVAYDSNFDIGNIDIMPKMNQNDMTRSFGAINKMIGYRPDRAPESLYDKSTDYFLNYAKTILSERLEILYSDQLISKEIKGVLSKDFSLFLYKAHVIDYEDEMIRNYHVMNGDKGTPMIQRIDRSYFRFLRDFTLNDRQYLYVFTFQEFQKAILQNEILGIPSIGESDIHTWLASTKAILSDLVGFNDGSYYDILAANAYGRQLTEEARPLTEKQKENIKNYWKNGEIAKILLRKNQQVAELDKFKDPVIINDVSSIQDDKIMDAIAAKHRGKVVLVDLWATWCTPCLDAMNQFKSAKNEFRNKDIVFVYVTNGSSPRKLWEEKIKGIGSEHYYLKDSQWEYIMNHFAFEYIPSYLLYNKEGVLVNKFSVFPGTDKVKQLISELL